VFHKFDIVGDERIFKNTITDEKYQGFEVKDRESKKSYIILSEDVKKMPVKVLSAEKIIDGRRVFYIADVATVKFPEDDKLGMRRFIDLWFPLNHTHPKDLLLAKFVTLVPTITKAFTRVITKQSFGKDGLINTIIDLTTMGANITEASDAKLGTMIDLGFSVFNEISGYSGETRKILQRFFLATAETNINTYEHTTTGSDKTKSRYDISNYGYSVFHNVNDYYRTRGLPLFEEMFSKAVFYRIFPIQLQGQVDDKEFIGYQYDVKSTVKENLDVYKQWIGYWYWLRNNFKYQTLNYDISKYQLIAEDNEKVSRWISTFTNIAKVIQMYSLNEVEFYTLMDELYKRHRDYIKSVQEEGLI
jgi:hypothetical protein